jgi:hypothetical protein
LIPNGSAREATPEKQAQRIQAAADVLKKLNPDILLLQEVRDYDACARLGEAMQSDAYSVSICSAFKGGKQQRGDRCENSSASGLVGILEINGRN